MKFPVLIRRDAADNIYKVVVPDLCLKIFSRKLSRVVLGAEEQAVGTSTTESSIEEFQGLLNIENMKTKKGLEQEIARAINNYLADNQKIAATIVATTKEVWVVKDNEGAEWLEVEVDIKLYNNCLNISNKLLPIITTLALFVAMGTGIYNDTLITAFTANIRKYQAGISTAYDVLSTLIFYIISETPQHMELLNKKLLSLLLKEDGKRSCYHLEEDFRVQNTCQIIYSYLTPWQELLKTTFGLSLFGLAGYNYYTGIISQYDAELILIQQAKEAGLTNLSFQTLKNLNNISFGLDKSLELIITIGEFFVAAKGVKYLVKQVESCLEPVGRCVRFFSCFGRDSRRRTTSPLLGARQEVRVQEQQPNLLLSSSLVLH